MTKEQETFLICICSYTRFLELQGQLDQQKIISLSELEEFKRLDHWWNETMQTEQKAKILAVIRYQAGRYKSLIRKDFNAIKPS